VGVVRLVGLEAAFSRVGDLLELRDVGHFLKRRSASAPHGVILLSALHLLQLPVFLLLLLLPVLLLTTSFELILSQNRFLVKFERMGQSKVEKTDCFARLHRCLWTLRSEEVSEFILHKGVQEKPLPAAFAFLFNIYTK